jgi:AcrR family transcriptional regulator
MGTTAPQDAPAALDEEGTRTAILAAAQRVAARDGVLEMSLTAVASEAGVAPTSVYSVFTSKNDLLLSVIADDLATLARAMREAPRPPDDQPKLLPAPSGCSNPEEPQAIPMTSAPEHPYTDDQPASGETVELPRRFPVAQVRRDQPRAGSAESGGGVLDLIAHLQESVAKLETRPVDAWLERRLREFERGLVALQDHHTERSTSENAIEERLRKLKESLEALEQRQIAAAEEAARGLAQRLEASDAHLRQQFSDVQAAAGQLAKRITALENAAFADNPELFGPREFTEQASNAAPAENPPHQVEAVEPPPVLSDLRNDTYLAEARRSAQAAAVAQDDVKQNPPKRTPRAMLYAAAGLLFVFVVLLFGAGIFLRNVAMTVQPVHVATTPAAHAVRREAPRPLRAKTQDASQSRLTKLAEAGDPTGELLVGLDYLNGNGFAKNDSVAFQWLSRAAAKGQPLAEYNLGTLYQDGRGVRADPVQAFQWYGAAALRGNRRAMHSLAIAYAEGLGTAKNLPEGVRWFERAATLGAVNSQFNLAVLYERGMGVPQSLTNAYKWYAIAAAQGDHESQARIAALTSALSPGDLADARSAAEAFKPDPVDPAANFMPRLPSQS